MVFPGIDSFERQLNVKYTKSDKTGFFKNPF